ncbi:MAG: TMEM165/GDT1 family protein [Micromonosporaceae bacterium]
MNPAVAATVFVLIFPAELPDKTALASLILGTRYRPLYVFTGAAAAFALHAVLAVAAGSLLGLAPHRWVELTVGVLFLVGAVMLLRNRPETEETVGVPRPDRGSFTKVASASFGLIMVAEFGDITQIITANLAAKYHAPIAVTVGAVAALWAVAALAILGGRGLVRLIPLMLIARLAAVTMAVLGVINVVGAATA